MSPLLPVQRAKYECPEGCGLTVLWDRVLERFRCRSDQCDWSGEEAP